LGEVLVGGRHRDVDEVGAQVGAGVDVGGVHAAPHHQPGVEAEVGHGADRFALLGAHRRDADFQLGNADGVELAGDVQLFVEENATPADCSPSRRVVSLMVTSAASWRWASLLGI
jgi:hypothetical protein